MEPSPCPSCGELPTVGPDLSGYVVHCFCENCYYGPGSPIGAGLRTDADGGAWNAIDGWNDAIEMMSEPAVF